MLARVTMWEGGTAEGIRAAAEEMQSNVSQGPPPGLKSTGFMMLVAPDGGHAMVIGLFANEADLRESEPILQEMKPPEGLGTRGTTEIYEVAVEARM